MNKKYDVVGIGNALVDIEFQVNDDFFEVNGIEKSLMTLVDEDRQNHLMEIIDTEHAKKQCGGSAANTVIAVSQFGGKSYYSCKVADDELGHFFLHDMKEAGVENNLDHNNLDRKSTRLNFSDVRISYAVFCLKKKKKKENIKKSIIKKKTKKYKKKDKINNIMNVTYIERNI